MEQVREIGLETSWEPVNGIAQVSIAERPALLREAYDLAVEGYSDMATWITVVVSLDGYAYRSVSITVQAPLDRVAS